MLHFTSIPTFLSCAVLIRHPGRQRRLEFFPAAGTQIQFLRARRDHVAGLFNGSLRHRHISVVFERVFLANNLLDDFSCGCGVLIAASAAGAWCAIRDGNAKFCIRSGWHCCGKLCCWGTRSPSVRTIHELWCRFIFCQWFWLCWLCVRRSTKARRMLCSQPSSTQGKPLLLAGVTLLPLWIVRVAGWWWLEYLATFARYFGIIQMLRCRNITMMACGDLLCWQVYYKWRHCSLSACFRRHTKSNRIGRLYRRKEWSAFDNFYGNFHL